MFKEKKALPLLFLATLTAFLVSDAHAVSFTYTTVDGYPGASYTSFTAISDSTIVGWYADHGGYGFTYDGTNYTSFSVPGGSETNITGISESGNLIGTFYDNSNLQHGFLYDGTKYITIDVPGTGVRGSNNYPTGFTYPTGISGNKIVGYYHYFRDYALRGFIYDGVNYTTFVIPDTYSTLVTGISGNNIVGGAGGHGFVYDGVNYTIIDFPGAATTTLYGISGNNIVGSYSMDMMGPYRSFLYDGSNYTTIDVPGSSTTYVTGISGNTVVGMYSDSNGNMHRYVAKPTNSAPIANAGQGQTVHVGSAVSLDGSLSSDPDEDYPLSYAWSIVSAPSGSSASLNDPNIVNPTLFADLPGNYTFQLTVADNKGTPSSPSQVVISTVNTPPVADAGADQFATVLGSTVTLDGSGSYDNDGDDISYEWHIVSVPFGSNAILNDPTVIKPTFTADIHGEYVFELSVKDHWSASNISRTMVGFNNIIPVAVAGNNQSAIIGDTIYLDGIGSYDANGDSLTYHWTIAGQPSGSQAVLSSPNTPQTTFISDLAGQYVFNLVVSDGLADSNLSVVNVSVITVQDAVAATLQTTISTINTIQADLFNNRNNKNALTNKINAILVNIESGNYEDALSQLQNDVLSKSDGCAEAGMPDPNDWITVRYKNPTMDEIQAACQAQGEVYSIITQAIRDLKGL